MNLWTIQRQADQSWHVSDPRGQTRATGLSNIGEVYDRLAALMIEDHRGQFAIQGDAVGARIRMTYTEGEETLDGGGLTRVIDPGATRFDRSEIPIMLLTENPLTGGHAGARLCGVADSLTRNGNATVVAEGTLDRGGEAGLEAERLIRDGVLSTHSPDLADETAEVECTEEDDDGFCMAITVRFTDCALIGITLTPMQALTSARVELIEASASSSEEGGDEGGEEPEADGEAAADRVTSLVAAGVQNPIDPPPRDWFEDPGLTALTPLEVTPEGRVYGHLAPWDGCHTGFPNECRTPPRGGSYRYFQTGELQPCGECPPVPVGQITLGPGHADRWLGYAAAAEHYDSTAAAVADIVVGEDQHGVWFSGALRPHVTAEQVRALRAGSLSGDWRGIRGRLELIAAHVVNAPGYPIPREQALVASGEVRSLVASGVRRMARLKDPDHQLHGQVRGIEGRLDALERIVDATGLRGQARDALVASAAER